MTRDQAVDKVREANLSAILDTSERMVRAIEALGLIKFDEPKTPREVIGDVLKKRDVFLSEVSLAVAIEVYLRRAGFKIVRAEPVTGNGCG